MKKIGMLFYLPAFILFNSCNEEFNPKTEFREKYALFAVIENNLGFNHPWLSAAVIKSFDNNYSAPIYDHTDNSISGCSLKVRTENSDILLRESGNQGAMFWKNSPLITYTAEGFPINYNSEYRMTAVLPDGKILEGSTRIPQVHSLRFSYEFQTGIHNRVDRFAYGNTWKITWDAYFEYLYFPKLELYYAKKTDSGLLQRSINVPMKYIKNNNKPEPVYPNYTWNKEIEFEYDCFDSVMISISARDSVKSDYYISRVVFGLIAFEPNLSSYFSSTHGYLDDYSIRLDETVYSNINGGLGVFGAFTKLTTKLEVNKSYIESFGYNKL